MSSLLSLRVTPISPCLMIMLVAYNEQRKKSQVERESDHGTQRESRLKRILKREYSGMKGEKNVPCVGGVNGIGRKGSKQLVSEREKREKNPFARERE